MSATASTTNALSARDRLIGPADLDASAGRSRSAPDFGGMSFAASAVCGAMPVFAPHGSDAPTHLRLRCAPAGSEPARRDRAADVERTAGAIDRGHGPLWQAARAAWRGDPRAMDRLILLARPMMLRVAVRRLRCRADAEDAVQNALLALVSVIRTYDPQRDPAPMLTALATRKAIDVLRRNRVRRERTICGEPPVAAVPPRAEELVLAAEMWERVLSLPDAQRDVMMLTLGSGLRYAEAAAASGRSVGAMKVAMHRARRRLASDAGWCGAEEPAASVATPGQDGRGDAPTHELLPTAPRSTGHRSRPIGAAARGALDLALTAPARIGTGVGSSA